MSNYLKIIFQCDLILKNKFLYFRGGGGGDHFEKYGKKFRRKNTPPLRRRGGPFLEGTSVCVRITRICKIQESDIFFMRERVRMIMGDDLQKEIRIAGTTMRSFWSRMKHFTRSEESISGSWSAINKLFNWSSLIPVFLLLQLSELCVFTDEN